MHLPLRSLALLTTRDDTYFVSDHSITEIMEAESGRLVTS